MGLAMRRKRKTIVTEFHGSRRVRRVATAGEVEARRKIADEVTKTEVFKRRAETAEAQAREAGWRGEQLASRLLTSRYAGAMIDRMTAELAQAYARNPELEAAARKVLATERRPTSFAPLSMQLDVRTDTVCETRCVEIIGSIPSLHYALRIATADLT